MPTSHGIDHAEISLKTTSAEETHAVGARLGRLLRPGVLVALIGPLGAGKTCFVQGLAEGLGIEGVITSPTFVLMRLHRGEVALCHVDAYRLSDAEELLDLGFDDWLAESVVALEWADTVIEVLPRERIEVVIDYADHQGRILRLRGLGDGPARIIERMSDNDHSGY